MSRLAVVATLFAISCAVFGLACKVQQSEIQQIAEVTIGVYLK